MSARPIDLKSALPKTQQLARLQQQKNNLHKHDLHNQVVNTNNQVEKRLKKVMNSEKTGHKKINKDKSDKNNTRGNQQHEKNQTEENADNNTTRKNKNKVLGNSIDIKI